MFRDFLFLKFFKRIQNLDREHQYPLLTTLDGGRLLVGAIFVLDFTIDLSSNFTAPLPCDVLLKSFIFGSSFNCIIGIDVWPILVFGGFFGGCIGI